MCVFTNKICKTYQKRLLFCHLCHARGIGVGGQKFNFSRHGHIAYQIKGNGE